MKEKFLVINAGSSSLKFSLYEIPDNKEIVNGYVEKIGNEDSFYTLKFNGQKLEKNKYITNHTEAVHVMLEELLANDFVSDIDEIKGVGHRVVHGGEIYKESILIDDEVIENIKELTKFAKLHHPGNLAGIEALRTGLPTVPMVAVFDTSFHQTMPEENYLYAVPKEWYDEHGVRKYGFHGTSHKYINEKVQEILGKKDVNLIICHIGSGASISCIKDGNCYDTTMGLTPLDGLIMGTRCGSIDSSIIEYIGNEKKLSTEQIFEILNKKSGLLGISGKNDFRDLETLAANGDKDALLAIKMFRNSIIKYIAEYYFKLNGNVDAIIFTAGVGENAIDLRKQIVDAISGPMDIQIDQEANANIARFKDNQSGTITTKDSKVKVMVIPTNEEYMILQDTINTIKINGNILELRK